ncbi:MAG: phosphate/phosphite/phosphonate ABC transporter substrate-binding protein [Acidiferrobacter sp.]
MLITVLTLAMGVTYPAHASSVVAGPTKTAYQPYRSIPEMRAVTPALPTAVTSRPWVLSAPRQGTGPEDAALFKPMARYLTAVLGHVVIYRSPTNSLTFAHNLATGRYDLVFAGPEIAAWTARHLASRPLVRFPGSLVFATVAQRASIRDLHDLVGQPVCALPPPNLATITFLHHYRNAVRQPFLVTVSGWHAAFKGVLAGRCVATILPLHNLRRYEHTSGVRVRILNRSRRYPSDTLSASARIPRAAQALIRAALLAPSGQRVTALLVHAEAASEWVPAHRAQYAGLSRLVRHMLYFGG